MFSVRVATPPQAAGRPKPVSYERIVSGGTTVDALTGRLYGFQFEYDRGVVIGESLVPVSQERVRQIVADSAVSTDLQRLLGDDLLCLVIIDSTTKTATLVSSISSSRPYYYTFHDGQFYCSTHIRNIEALGVPLAPDDDVFAEFMVYRYVVPPRSLFRNVHRLVGGQLVLLDLTTGAVRNEAYFRFQAPSDQSSRPDCETVELLEGRLRSQMLLGLERFHHPSILLSGGLDSSLLAALAVKEKPDIKSVSSSFSFLNRADVEQDYALSVAKQYDIDHHTFEGGEEQYLQGLVEATAENEEPVHHLQSVMLYLLFKQDAARRYDVMFCGEGADGLFGNDMHAKLNRYGGIINFMRTTGAQHLYRGVLKLSGTDSYRWKYFEHEFGGDLDSDKHILWTMGQYGDPDLVEDLFDVDRQSVVTNHQRLMRQYTDEPLLQQVTIQSLLTEGHITMAIWGKLAESHAIALHYPFTGPKIVDGITAVPWDQKLREGKYYIRAMLRHNNYPEEFITRPKLSFGFPHQHWSLPGKLFQPVVDMAGEMYDRGLLQRLQTDQPGHAMVLWNLLSYYLWRKLFFERSSVKDLATEIISRHRVLQKRH